MGKMLYRWQRPVGLLTVILLASASLTTARQAQALPGTTNLAPAGTATASTAFYGSAIGDAIDGNRDGAFGNGSVYHSPDDGSDLPLFYEVDLGVDAYIERVQILSRTDQFQGVFGNFRITVAEDDGTGNPGAITFTQDYLPTTYEFASWGTTDPGASAAGGAFGRHVRFERLDNNFFLVFAEFEVIGKSTPLEFTAANNIAAGKPVTTSSPPGFGALLESGNDNNIDGNIDPVLNMPQFYHSTDQAVGEFWQVDLGAPTPLDFLELFVRSEKNTTTEFKISVLDASQVEVGSFIVASGAVESATPGYDFTLDAAGMTGQYLRVETTKNEFLAFSELRAWASAAPPDDADFDGDGDIDGRDFLVWQRGGSPNSLSAGDLALWQDQYGTSPLGAVATVPEPSTAIVLSAVILVSGIASRRYFQGGRIS